ncbi:carbohydrate kinase [Kitasatospora paracochleata]|uniref:carbohydrate kinase family protein n=1 Tax=Kitasatospora paracochleata TaxID=58354 RepID=UPI0031DC262C
MITVVGEVVMDLVERPDGTISAHPGGSPGNVAVGLSRLGNPVSLLTRYGRDRYGAMLSGHLTGVGFALLGTPEDDRPTSVAIARPDANGVASYEFTVDWRLPPGLDAADLPAPLECLHTGSIAAVLEPGASVVRRLVEQLRGRCTVSYDPNCRPGLMGSPAQARPRITGLVALADVVKVSDEDLAWLYPGRSAAEVARDWLARGPALVVVTRGAEGAYSLCRAGAVERPAPQVRVVDTVGAGDAFTAGLLDGLRRRDLLGPAAAERLRTVETDVLAELLDEAMLVSALTCARAGANPPTAGI